MSRIVRVPELKKSACDGCYYVDDNHDCNEPYLQAIGEDIGCGKGRFIFAELTPENMIQAAKLRLRWG